MSQADIDVVLDQFAAVNERDWARGMERFASDVVLIASETSGPKSGRFEGVEAVGEWFGDWFRSFDRDYHFDVEEARELEGGTIFLSAAHGGTGRASGVEVHGQNSYLYRVRDGRVSQIGFFATREEALEAAALPEWSEGEPR